MRPVVIKIGTGVLTRECDGVLDRKSLTRLVTAVADLIESGQPCILVSSGAVGAGVSKLRLSEYPSDIEGRQVCAAIGQSSLMHNYESLFSNYGLNIAQILLTSEDLDRSDRLDRLDNVFTRFSNYGHIVPIINENDVISVEGISFGDNDMLAARVAGLIDAKLLVLFSNIDGLLLPDSNEVISEVRDINDVTQYIRSDKGKFSIGGMESKLKAVAVATSQGVPTVIAHGRQPQRLEEIVKGGGICTRFHVD